MLKDMISQIDDNDLDIVAANLKNTIDDMIKMEKRYASIGIRVRKTLNEIVCEEE